MSRKPKFVTKDEKRGQSPRDYWPLIALVLIAILAATAITLGSDMNHLSWMHYFMGIFFCQFALLKFFHPEAFADGFQMYDVLAKRSRIYAYFYPAIELFLGLGYLSFYIPYFFYIATIFFMFLGAYGVFKALLQGLDIKCPCMGSILDVPLSTVTLTEDLVMGILAIIMLFLR